MLYLIAFLAVSSLVVLASLWNGFALAILWGWFMVPTFGLPPLPLPSAIGIALVVGYLTHQKMPDSKGHMLEDMTFLAMRPLLALLVGWVVKQWM